MGMSKFFNLRRLGKLVAGYEKRIVFKVPTPQRRWIRHLIDNYVKPMHEAHVKNSLWRCKGWFLILSNFKDTAF